MDDQFVEIYSKVIHEYDGNLEQLRLVVSSFREQEFIQIRKYYLDFNGDWYPTKDGISFPISINNIKELFCGVAEIMSLAESKSAIEEYFGEIINTVYQG